MIKLAILDIDGVMTDGTKYYDRDGNVVQKTFCDKDWTAIKRLRAIGVEVLVITGDPYNKKILENRNIPVIVNRENGEHKDKSEYLPQILKDYNCTSKEILYIGDDLFDIGIMRLVGYPFCPSNSPRLVRQTGMVLQGKGGDNLIVELFDYLELNKLIPIVQYDQVIAKINELDLKEKVLMKDITLYGHLTVDTILDGESERKTLGSIANVWKALLELDSTLKIGLSPIDIGEALIYIDKQSAQRYSKASLNLRKNLPKIIHAKINHLVYLNEMSSTEFIVELDGIVAADVCSGKKLNKDILKYVDYLFISDEDVDDFQTLVEATKGWVILHSSTGSVFSNGTEKYSYNIPEEKHLKNVNVLGAGDTFASCFLYKLLGGTGNIQDWIEFAHLKTTEIIRNSI